MSNKLTINSSNLDVIKIIITNIHSSRREYRRIRIKWRIHDVWWSKRELVVDFMEKLFIFGKFWMDSIETLITNCIMWCIWKFGRGELCVGRKVASKWTACHGTLILDAHFILNQNSSSPPVPHLREKKVQIDQKNMCSWFNFIKFYVFMVLMWWFIFIVRSDPFAFTTKVVFWFRWKSIRRKYEHFYKQPDSFN